MLQMMVDLETLSLSTRAVVFQIGVAVFNLGGEIIHSERMDLDILPQLMCGRIFDRETQRWWMTQEKSAWSRPSEQVCEVENCLEALSNIWTEYRCGHVWANSPSFDLVILKSLAKDFNMKLPWTHKHEMDVRTIRGLAKIIGCELASREPSHDAQRDCEDQVATLMESIGKLRLASQISFMVG